MEFVKPIVELTKASERNKPQYIPVLERAEKELMTFFNKVGYRYEPGLDLYKKSSEARMMDATSRLNQSKADYRLGVGECVKYCANILDEFFKDYYIGRVGQSLGQEKQPRNIRARYAQCIYMYDFLNEFANEVSEKMQLNLRHINAKFAEFIFGDFIILPYKECKKYSLDCTKCIEIVDKTKHSSIWNRYKKLPFFIYYILEWVRYFKNKKISK